MLPLWPVQFCNPMDSSPLDSSVPGFLQARRLEWVAIFFSIIPAWPSRNLILLSTFHPQLLHSLCNLCILSVIRRLIHLHKRNWESHCIWFLPVSLFSASRSQFIHWTCDCPVFFPHHPLKLCPEAVVTTNCECLYYQLPRACVSEEMPLCGLSCFRWSWPSQGVAKAWPVTLEPVSFTYASIYLLWGFSKLQFPYP